MKSPHAIYCPHCGKIAATVVFESKVDLPADVTLSSPIEAYPWPTGILKIFKNSMRLEKVEEHWKDIDAPIKTFADLCSLTRTDLLRLPNMGRKSFAVVECVLASYGLHLKG